jgi:hypothetical protein
VVGAGRFAAAAKNSDSAAACCRSIGDRPIGGEGRQTQQPGQRHGHPLVLVAPLAGTDRNVVNLQALARPEHGA